MQLPQWLVVIGWIVSPVATAVVAAVAASGRRRGDEELEAARRREERDRLIAEGVKELLWARLEDMHESYVVLGRPCDTAKKQIADGVYSAYHALGGNGVGTHYYEEIVEAHRASRSDRRSKGD